MKCEECETEMIIDTWSGWVWICVYCDFIGRAATDEEVEEMEREENK